MTVDELLERVTSRELTEWGLLFEIQNEEYEARKHDGVVEMGQRPGEGPTDDEDDEEDEDENG